jgi:ABC-2 type transport system ATP-binding protein
MTQPVIVARELVKYYREQGFFGSRRLALDKVSLEINPGETVALLGPNGAGKTTFLRILFGLILPTDGELKVFDEDCQDANWRKRAGYVPEFYTPPRFLSGRELLEISAKAHGVSRADFEKNIEWLDQAIGLKDILRTRIRNYSRGMLQQLALADCLVHNPELIVLDEPTANLDAISRRKLRELLRELAKMGKTILLSSHILSEIEELCDKVIFIKEGRIIQQGKTKDLLMSEGGYIIRFKTPSVMPEKLAGFGTITSDPELNVSTIETRTEVEKDQAVRILSENYIPIELLELKQKTLEQYFMEIVQEKQLEKYLLEIIKE